jgi:DNA-binding beta-propeller fold protein YncE
MRDRRRTASTWIGLALVLAALSPQVAAAADGSLTRLDGKAGCLSAAGERGMPACTRVRGLGEPRGVAVSPDGRSVYVTSERANTVAAFRRNRQTGALRQLPRRAGCVRAGGGLGCTRARGLAGARDIVVSGDGRNVYVAGANAVAVFRRNRRTGGLRQLSGRAGCLSGRALEPPGPRCRHGRALAVSSGLVLSPSGRFLYVASMSDAESAPVQGGIAVFRRSPRTGGLVQRRGANGCVTADAGEGCARGSLPDLGATGLEIDRGGENLYAAAIDGVIVFDRARGGVLRQLPPPAGCVRHLGEGGCTPARAFDSGPRVLAASPRGLDNLYASSSFSVFPGVPHGAVVNLVRDPASGVLSQSAGTAGCISLNGAQGCAPTHSEMSSPAGIEVSADGRNVYTVQVVELGGDGVVVFGRDPATGELAQLAGRAGCIAHNPPQTGCADTQGLTPTAIALSRDGRSAYVTSGGSGPGTVPFPRAPDAVAVYRRTN